MKQRYILFLAAALCLSLSSCTPAGTAEPLQEPPMPASTPALEITADPIRAPAGDSDENVLLSLVDFSSYEAELDESDWTALSGFFPVLTGEEPFWGEHLSSLEESVSPPQEIFLPDFFQVLLGTDLDGQSFPYRFESFALCDLDGDDERELALWSNCAGGWYVVLHREADGFYGAYMPVRWFAGLQQNGVFCGMGAMANVNYGTLRFSEGHFYSVTLGSTSYRFGENDTVHYYIGEAEVSHEDFELWLDNFLVGDAVWHSARTSNFT